MGESPALVVGDGSSTGDGRVEHDNAIVLGVAGVRRREGGISQESLTGTGNEADAVDVQSLGTALPQLGFHRSLDITTKSDG